VTWQNSADVRITGNRCRKGEVYGREEILSPARVVTATACVNDASFPRLPVKTNQALSREHIDELLQKIYKIRLDPPIRRGAVIIRNFHDTEVDVIATRSIPPAESWSGPLPIGAA
jgi:CxxC motif-containing protein